MLLTGATDASVVTKPSKCSLLLTILMEMAVNTAPLSLWDAQAAAIDFIAGLKSKGSLLAIKFFATTAIGPSTFSADALIPPSAQHHTGRAKLFHRQSSRCLSSRIEYFHGLGVQSQVVPLHCRRLWASRCWRNRTVTVPPAHDITHWFPAHRLRCFIIPQMLGSLSPLAEKTLGACARLPKQTRG